FIGQYYGLLCYQLRSAIRGTNIAEDAASDISGGDGAGGAVARVVRAGGAALSQAWERAATGGSRAHAADLLFAAVVQPVGPGGRRGAVRLGGDAAVRGH